MKYRGREGSIEYSSEDGVYYGKLLGVDDVVLYEGNTPLECIQAFVDAVDDYVEEKEEQNDY